MSEYPWLTKHKAPVTLINGDARKTRMRTVYPPRNTVREWRSDRAEDIFPTINLNGRRRTVVPHGDDYYEADITHD